MGVYASAAVQNTTSYIHESKAGAKSSIFDAWQPWSAYEYAPLARRAVSLVH